jgi:hypothetical protein
MRKIQQAKLTHNLRNIVLEIVHNEIPKYLRTTLLHIIQGSGPVMLRTGTDLGPDTRYVLDPDITICMKILFHSNCPQLKKLLGKVKKKLGEF